MPASHPNRIPTSLSNPIRATTKANPCAIRRSLKSACSASRKRSDKPARTKAIAVVGFIATKPGKTRFRASMSSTQPTSTRQPIRTATVLATCEKVLAKDSRPGTAVSWDPNRSALLLLIVRSFLRPRATRGSLYSPGDDSPAELLHVPLSIVPQHQIQVLLENPRKTEA